MRTTEEKKRQAAGVTDYFISSGISDKKQQFLLTGYIYRQLMKEMPRKKRIAVIAPASPAAHPES